MSDLTDDELDAICRARGVVPRLARAWASMYGKMEQFDAEKAGAGDLGGYYEGYLTDAEELWRRTWLLDP
jgi:hypothetical protein